MLEARIVAAKTHLPISATKTHKSHKKEFQNKSELFQFSINHFVPFVPFVAKTFVPFVA
jgi:hypothetical protein